MRKNFVRKVLFYSLPFYIFLSVFSFLIPTDAHAETTETVITDGHSNGDVKRGERFFKGLLPFKRDYNSCVSCHNLIPTDTLNWNPSAMAIAIKYADKDFAGFQAAVMQPNGVKMEASHVGFNIKEEDLKTVKVYLDHLAESGLSPVKPTYNTLIIFLFLGLLITWSVIELIFLHKVKWKIIPLLIFLGAFGWQVQLIVTDAIKLGRQQNYAPDQPIKFSHKVHAGENGIDCMYCHTTADESKSAGIPATNLCMNCHIIIREGTNSGKFEIAKVVEANEKGQSIEWTRIHNLPDHVFFSHEIHVGSGKLDCAQCHGPVAEMDIMRQNSDLSMGWCVNCHRDTKVDFGNNGYYESFVQLHEQLKTGEIDSVTAADVGANDCMRCHY
ncbi:MAG TPA: cytochrome c3 family protein [Draconibacterium sp.]|nr:cytochrome c3 family protein [Draconibacterium sp.]